MYWGHNIPGERGQYYDCWCPGFLCHQVIISHDIDWKMEMLVFVGMKSVSLAVKRIRAKHTKFCSQQCTCRCLALKVLGHLQTQWWLWPSLGPYIYDNSTSKDWPISSLLYIALCGNGYVYCCHLLLSHSTTILKPSFQMFCLSFLLSFPQNPVVGYQHWHKIHHCKPIWLMKIKLSRFN